MESSFIHTVTFEALSLVMILTLKRNKTSKSPLGGNFRRVLKHFPIRKSEKNKEPMEM